MASSTPVTILFHGNCPDGWFATFIAYSYLKPIVGDIKMYPVSANQPKSHPRIHEMKGRNVLLLDISVDERIRRGWLKNGVLGIQCIDHHASSVEHWPIGPNGVSTVIDTSRCAAYQTWMRFFPMLPIPVWLEQLDRIDRWQNPSYEDRCVREVLSLIAHLPVEKKLQDAIVKTEEFINMYNNPEYFQQLMHGGKQILDKKDGELLVQLQKGQIVNLVSGDLVEWNLPSHWLGLTVFIIDNSFIPFDTTEAAHIVFHYMPNVNVFVNYRRKGFRDRDTHQEKSMIVYSARSRGFDVTAGTLFRGHPSAAGASLVFGEAPLFPFIRQEPGAQMVVG